MYPFKYVIRLYWPNVSTIERLERSVNYLKQYRDACDEVCILTEGDCMDLSYISLEEYEKRSKWMSFVLDTFRKAGFKVHINVMITYGHYDETKVDVTDVAYPTMVGHDGTISTTLPCPNSSKYKSYIAEKYRLYAKCNPDYLWLDDDIRMHYRHPIQYGCFCKICLDKFNQLHDTCFDRDLLVKELMGDHFPKSNELREKWLQFNRSTIKGSMEEIEKEVHGINENIVLGLMTADYAFEEYSAPEFKLYGEILKNKNGQSAYRPGGFFWEDSQPMKAVYKGTSIARQVCMSKRDAEVLSEVEGIPYETLQKSPAMTAFEISCHIGLGGVSGIMINLMECMKNDWTEQKAYLEMLSEKRPFFEGLAESISGHRQLGFYPYLHDLQWAYKEQRDIFTGFNNLNDMMPAYEMEKLIELGIPLSFDPEQNYGIIVSGETARSISKEKLTEFSKKGLYIDGEGVKLLNEKFGDESFSGVNCVQIHNDGIYEKFNEHPINGRYQGYNRDIHYYASKIKSWGLTMKGAQPLTDIYDYKDRNVGCYGASIHDNPFGGKTAVIGFKPWANIHFLHKRHQITEIFDWLCDYKLPVKIISPYKISMAIWGGNGEAIVVLYNISFQPIKELLLGVKYEGQVEELDEHGKWDKGNSIVDGVLTIHSFSPWSVRVFRIKY